MCRGCGQFDLPNRVHMQIIESGIRCKRYFLSTSKVIETSGLGEESFDKTLEDFQTLSKMLSTFAVDGNLGQDRVSYGT